MLVCSHWLESSHVKVATLLSIPGTGSPVKATAVLTGVLTSAFIEFRGTPVSEPRYNKDSIALIGQKLGDTCRMNSS